MSGREGGDFGVNTDPSFTQIGVMPDLDIRFRRHTELYINDIPYNYCREGDKITVNHLVYGKLTLDGKTLKLLEVTPKPR